MKAIYRNIKAAFAALILSVSGVAINAQTLPSLMLDQDPASLALGMSGVASQAGAFAIQNTLLQSLYQKRLWMRKLASVLGSRHIRISRQLGLVQFTVWENSVSELM